jgi:hypothetical protein
MRITEWAVRGLCVMQGMQRPFVTFAGMDVFRGTVGWGEARLDLDVRIADFHGLKVHRGMLEMYRESNAELDSDARVVCGYSCGGALAILHAVERATAGEPCDEVVTIAAPAFVHPQSVARLADLLSPTRVTRVHNVRDAIPYLPPHLAHYGDPVPLRSETKNLLQAHLAQTYVALLLADAGEVAER